jgi:hypothetical protein
MAAITRFPLALKQIDQFGVFTDFTDDQSDISWVDFIADLASGSGLTVGDEVGGVMTMAITDATDNDEMSLYSPNEIFRIAANKPIYATSLVQYTEAATNAANFAGLLLANAPVANTLIDDGGGLRTTGSVFGIFKIDGETVWRCRSGNNGANTTTISTTTAGGSAYQKLEIEIADYTATHCQVTFYCDDKPLIDATGKPIVHTVAYASATEMAVGFVGKNGSTSPETFKCDYIGAWQKR